MRLLIISNMTHCMVGERALGWGPTVEEIDHLASLFDSITHIAFLHGGEPPASMLPYSSGRVRLVAVRPSGGVGPLAKLGVAAALPGYARVILKELLRSDVVHLRCPANIAMMASVMLFVLRRPKFRWVKYAGNWCPERSPSFSSTIQRWWLRRNLHRGTVTVNGIWPRQQKHVYSFVNPCVDENEVRARHGLGADKSLDGPINLLFAGRVCAEKGVDVLFGAMRTLVDRGIGAELTIAGDGPERPRYERMARSLGLSESVVFCGWLPRAQMGELYARAHFLVLPSRNEGWPKVFSEAMAYGAVPIARSVGAIPQIFERFGCGRAISSENPEDYASAIADYCSNPDRWRTESMKGAEAARESTYGRYLQHVREMFREVWGLELDAHVAVPESRQ